MCSPVVLFQTPTDQTQLTKHDRAADMELAKMLRADFPCNVVVKEVTEGRGKGGLGLFSTGIIKKGDTACLYAGDYVHWTYVPKSAHAISVGLNSDYDHIGHVICGLGVRAIVERISPALCGSIINSTEKNSVLIDADANVEPVKDRSVLYESLGKDEFNRDVGLAAIAMVATRDIAPEEQILWSYFVTETTDTTPCNLTKILNEALELKNRAKKRVTPQPVE